MSRASSALPQRPLSTTEELEKLEQQITLTLQEIDQNFNKAHRIVTSSILPVVEQYGENCRAVWDASKFWKQFFEAAANVSLSGYEELANDGDTSAAEEGSTTVTHDETSTDYTPQRTREGVDQTPTYHNTGRDDSLLTDGDGDLSGSTPRPPATKSIRPQLADMDSPYEALRRELKQGKSGSGAAAASASTPTALRDSSALMDVDDDDGGDDDSSAADSVLLAQRTARLPDMSMTPRQSPDERRARALEEERAEVLRQKDPLMHRVLDKTFRIQATPHKTATGAATTAGGIARGISPMRLRVTDRGKELATEPTRTVTKTAAWQDSSPMSSPEMAVPQLRSAAFMSPVRQAYRSKLAAAASGPRTPGVSVQTPARNKTATATLDFSLDDEDETDNALGKKVAAAAGGTPLRGAAAGGSGMTRSRKDRDEITWESSDEDGDDLYGGMSPPKTISFALPPSKLLQTPAREASKRIVDDILMSAGGDDDMDKLSEYSPTMVKMNANILDDTF